MEPVDCLACQREFGLLCLEWWAGRTCGAFAYGAAAVFDQAADSAYSIAGHGACGGDAGVQVAHGLVLDVVFDVGNHDCGLFGSAMPGGEARWVCTVRLLLQKWDYIQQRECLSRGSSYFEDGGVEYSR